MFFCVDFSQILTLFSYDACLCQSWQEEVLVYQEEMEGLSILAQQVLDETHVSSRISSRATQITARYHILLLQLLVTERLVSVHVLIEMH